MNQIESKTHRALQTNKLNPQILGERRWYKYFIRETELVWGRNYHDGYQIEIYSDSGQSQHLATVVI